MCTAALAEMAVRDIRVVLEVPEEKEDMEVEVMFLAMAQLGIAIW
ncbi:MAG: hypothetical protein WA148_04410 [Actinomycetota bacterium]